MCKIWKSKSSSPILAIHEAKYAFTEWAKFNLCVDISKRISGNKWEILPKRWIVERTFPWMNHFRGLSKNYEITKSSTDAMIKIAHSHYLLKRFWKQLLNFFDEQVPDAITLLKFCFLLEKDKISQQYFQTINRDLKFGSCMMRGDSIVDAPIIPSPLSTKNATGKRDTEINPIRKDQQYYFGLKTQVGVDAGSGNVNTLKWHYQLSRSQL